MNIWLGKLYLKYSHPRIVNVLLKKRICWYCKKCKIEVFLHYIRFEEPLLIQYLMKLMMFIGNDLIEAVPLDETRIPKPGYLGSFKRMLKEKYKEVILQFAEPPEFLVIAA